MISLLTDPASSGSRRRLRDLAAAHQMNADAEVVGCRHEEDSP
jgi:hypothetical protein